MFSSRLEVSWGVCFIYIYPDCLEPFRLSANVFQIIGCICKLMSLKETGMNSKGRFSSHHPCFIILNLSKVTIIYTLESAYIHTKVLWAHLFHLFMSSSYHLFGSYRVLALCWVGGYNDDDDDNVRIQMSGHIPWRIYRRLLEMPPSYLSATTATSISEDTATKLETGATVQLQ